jgi:FkbM family methyltransferase
MMKKLMVSQVTPNVKGSIQLKQLAKKFGRRLRRLTTAAKPAFVPKLVHFSGPGVVFDFWITSAECGSWYDPASWARNAELQQLSNLIKPGDQVLEIGCNIGFTTMVLARLVGESGFVLALDIVPDNVILAQATAFLNGATNVQILHTAAGEVAGEIGFSNQLNGQVDRDASSKATMTSSDALDMKFGPFNVLKVDVEGYEGFVLKGATRLLARLPKLALEIHGKSIANYGTTIDELLRLFQAQKYEGTMFIRPEYKVEDFHPGKLGTDAIGNLFLSPKPA